MAEQRPEKPARKLPRPNGGPNGGMRVGRGLFGWVLFIGLAVKNLLGLAMLITVLSYWPHSFSQRFTESIALAERLLRLSH